MKKWEKLCLFKMKLLGRSSNGIKSNQNLSLLPLFTVRALFIALRTYASLNIELLFLKLVSTLLNISYYIY